MKENLILKALEKLFHYVWKHKLFPPGQLAATDGREVEIVDPGLLNRDSGPDFFNAKVRIGGEMWVGNVELHIRSSHWYQHGHDKDAAYDSVVLHVVTEADCDVRTSSDLLLPQLVLPIPANVKENYEALLREDRYPRCHKIIPTMTALSTHAWMAVLQTERLERKTQDIMRRVEACEGSWEDAFFQTLARNFGFGINSDAFELWSKSFSLSAVGHHRDDIFQIEAFFLGQAGLLEPSVLPERHREAAMMDTYLARLRQEYSFLRHKFGLQPIDGKLWRFLRLRPQNFPFIRLSQLAQLYHDRRAGLSQIVNCKCVKDVYEALDTQVTDYWKSHYIFGEESTGNSKKLSRQTKDVLIINTVVPMLFAYGTYKRSAEMTDRALALLEELKPEDNNIVRIWQECGLNVSNAGDTQALIQLKKEYCDRKECLRCRIGYQYLKKN